MCNMYKYILWNSFETTEEALQSIDSTVWVKWYKNSCADGQKRRFEKKNLKKQYLALENLKFGITLLLLII
ncbi:hypothetical protein BpHYR1_005969 [Brachionus plicatilis]|uniref:Uncharacterized protein n=1 Tax=Brachionus plicatilis TaxID=10195 RepID=A0A3M7PKW7_BRAPC|nr:hypothetical protein BpHYR1_005969 [Brachionus plicatilis]